MRVTKYIILGFLITACGAQNNGANQVAANATVQHGAQGAELVASITSVTCNSSNENQLVYSQADAGFYYCASNDLCTAISVQGSAGKDGAAGAQGKEGNKGESGAAGSAGAKGDTGATGIQGATGTAGSTLKATYMFTGAAALGGNSSMLVKYATVSVFSDGSLYFQMEYKDYDNITYAPSFYVSASAANSNYSKTLTNYINDGYQFVITITAGNTILTNLTNNGSASTVTVTVGTSANGGTPSNNTSISLTYQN